MSDIWPAKLSFQSNLTPSNFSQSLFFISYSLIFTVTFSLLFNPFVPNAPFLYPMKTPENLMVFLCFQGVEKGCIGMNHWNKAVHASSNDWIRSSISEISKQNMVYCHLHNLVSILKTDQPKKILNNSALNIEPCVTPNTISVQVLSVGNCFT